MTSRESKILSIRIADRYIYNSVRMLFSYKDEYDYVHESELKKPNSQPPFPPRKGGSKWIKTPHGWTSYIPETKDSAKFNEELFNYELSMMMKKRIGDEIKNKNRRKKLNKHMGDYTFEGYKIDELYDLDAGVSEGYTIGKHTDMVNDVLDEIIDGRGKNWGELKIGDESFDRKKFMRLLALTHDLGKGVAVEDGDKMNQKDYNKCVTYDVFSKSKYREGAELAKNLVDGDWLGNLLTRRKSVGDIYDELGEKAKESNVPLKTFFSLLSDLYAMDAGSYPYLRDTVGVVKEGDNGLEINSPQYDALKDRIQENQIKSEEFKDWFGDWEKDPEKSSKMVDDSGKTKVYTHWSKIPIKDFDKEKKTSISQDLGRGFYFSDGEGGLKEWKSYVKTRMNRDGGGIMKEDEEPVRYDVYLNAKKPWVVGESKLTADEVNNYLESSGKEKLSKREEKQFFDYVNRETNGFMQFSHMGHYGINHEDLLTGLGYDAVVEPDSQVMVFEPEQIKSVDNIGSFDEDDKNMFAIDGYF